MRSRTQLTISQLENTFPPRNVLFPVPVIQYRTSTRLLRGLDLKGIYSTSTSTRGEVFIYDEIVLPVNYPIL